MKQLLFRGLEFVESAAAFARGKGYGGMSIDREVGSVCSLLGHKPTLVIDIGGNVGNWAAAMLKTATECRIHIFEPAATNVAMLNERFGNEPRITVAPFAAAEHAGDAKLFADSAGSSLASLTQREIANVDFSYAEQVKVVRFEQYWRDVLGAAPIDVAKLDVEGHELDALKGFGAALDHVGVVQFEFGGTSLDTRIYFRDIWKLLTGHGFAIYRVSPFGLYQIKRYKEREESFNISNYVAKRV